MLHGLTINHPGGWVVKERLDPGPRVRCPGFSFMSTSKAYSSLSEFFEYFEYLQRKTKNFPVFGVEYR